MEDAGEGEPHAAEEACWREGRVVLRVVREGEVGDLVERLAGRGEDGREGDARTDALAAGGSESAHRRLDRVPGEGLGFLDWALES